MTDGQSGRRDEVAPRWISTELFRIRVARLSILPVDWTSTSLNRG